LWIVALLLTPIFQFLTLTESAAQSLCEKELTEAQRQYDNGLFKEAMAAVEQCLKKSGLNNDAKKQAYELLAQIHVANDDTVQARTAIQKLLEATPDYNPYSVAGASALFVKLVHEAQLVRKPPKGGGKKLLWIGGGTALVAGGIVFLLSQKEEKSGSQPTGFTNPPGRPPGN
jgi:hypothetical protein